MKYKFRYNRGHTTDGICQECGLGGLTLVTVGAKIEGKQTIYKHQTKFMCVKAGVNNGA